jgi:hypothetical protein
MMDMFFHLWWFFLIFVGKSTTSYFQARKQGRKI